jgi:3-oxoacyl-[acyl-carrier protein] reductase
MSGRPVLLISGTRTGLGRSLALHYLEQGWRVAGCSRGASTIDEANYVHHSLDVVDEAAVREMIAGIKRWAGRLDALINNAGVASMNHALLTPMETVRRVMATNVEGTFLLCREAARLMRGSGCGRIVNISTVAVPLRLEGEAIYAASKAAIESLTRVLARELASLGITCNAVGPTPIETDLIRNVPREKIDRLIAAQAIHRLGQPRDVANVVDFFLRPESDFVTGQVVYLGGVS